MATGKQSIDRRALRYALFRVQNGNPEESHSKLIEEFNITKEIKNFSITWDVDFDGAEYEKKGSGLRKHREINRKLGR